LGGGGVRTTNTWHPTAGDLSDFAVGKLSDVRAAAVERHLDECCRCVEAVAQAPADDFILLVKRTARQQLPAAAEQSIRRQPRDSMAVAQAASSPIRPRHERESGRNHVSILAWYLLSPATILPLATAVVLVIVLSWL
jgi:anti-sigma factor RsiW